MTWFVRSSGCEDHGLTRSLATPQASKNVNVYGLSVDVFILEER